MIIIIEVNLVEVLSVSKNKMDQKEGFRIVKLTIGRDISEPIKVNKKSPPTMTEAIDLLLSL